VNRSLIVDTAVRILFPSIVVLSLYFLFAGHNQPGGGFAGGLIAGAGIALRYVAGGVDEVRQITRIRPWTVAGVGLAIATVTAAVPVTLGEQVLEHDDVSADLPVLGVVKATTALPFDIGVYVLVVGVVLMIFEAFGERRGAS
jgi:multisubunit Na+/H+ antiporter MnhB subunit